MASTAIAEKLTDATDRLAAAKRQRAEAVLSGAKPNHRAVLDAEGELDALQQAANIELARQREAAAAERRKEQQAAAVAAGEREAERLDALARAESDLRDFIANIREALTAGKDVVRLFRAAGLSAPLSIDGPGYVVRLGQRTAAILSTYGGHPMEMGSHLKWRASTYHATDDWQDGEAAMMAANMTAVTKAAQGNQSNG